MVTIVIDGRRTKVRHLRRKGDAWYFQPSGSMRAGGFRPEALGKDLAAALARAEALNREWDAIRAEAPAEPREIAGGWKWLVRQYERSDWYKALKPRSREATDMALRVILSSPMAKRQVSACGRRDVRNLVARLSAVKGEEHVRKVVKTLRRILYYAIELEMITVNPAAKLGLKGGRPRRQRWLPEQVKAFVDKAIEMQLPGWALAAMIGYDTTQRLTDILTVQHGHFDGEGIDFAQGKTDKALWCPLYAETIGLYKRTPKRATTIVYGERGTPIARGYFNRGFRKIAAAAGLPADLQFRDLRRTGISEVLAKGGRAEPISGHAPGSLAIRVYEVVDKEASRTVANLRRSGPGPAPKNKSGR